HRPLASLLSYPTRRSSDLTVIGSAYSHHLDLANRGTRFRSQAPTHPDPRQTAHSRPMHHEPSPSRTTVDELILVPFEPVLGDVRDRKRTRLNSSHVSISYA